MALRVGFSNALFAAHSVTFGAEEAILRRSRPRFSSQEFIKPGAWACEGAVNRRLPLTVLNAVLIFQPAK